MLHGDPLFFSFILIKSFSNCPRKYLFLVKNGDLAGDIASSYSLLKSFHVAVVSLIAKLFEVERKSSQNLFNLSGNPTLSPKS